MKKRTAWAVLGVSAAALLIFGFVARGDAAATSYRFVAVTRGDVESVVTATGTLEATETVEIGTQVSGQIADLRVDFNDRVVAGQLLARIDPTILEQEVRSAEASLARSRAELEQAERTLRRSEALFEQKVITDSEHDAAQYSWEVASAAYESAEIAVERARRNLEYTQIRATIDGVVVARNVDVGQTVAASLSAPTLFIVAEDLGKMEILASVDESDIGQIRDGQEARFTVQAYPTREFIGSVRQVRLQSTTQENVVSYSVVIEVDNVDGTLLPGMTATVEFLVERAENVLMVPNTALRFRPTEAMQAELTPATGTGRDGGAARAGGAATEGPAAREGGAATEGDAPSEGAASGARRQPPSNGAVLWYVDEAGRLAIAPVRTGLSDGQYTAIESPSAALVEGLQIIAAVTAGEATATSSNPFQASSQTNSGPPGRGGF